MNEETFKVRAYGYGELAQLYFPSINKKSASWQLRIWLVANGKVLEELKKSGYKEHKRLLTPAQVKIIVDEFGEP
jgi:hypothetical protein